MSQAATGLEVKTAMMTKVNYKLEPSMIRDIKAVAQASRISEAELVRRAVAYALAEFDAEHTPNSVLSSAVESNTLTVTLKEQQVEQLPLSQLGPRAPIPW